MMALFMSLVKILNKRTKVHLLVLHQFLAHKASSQLDPFIKPNRFGLLTSKLLYLLVYTAQKFQENVTD